MGALAGIVARRGHEIDRRRVEKLSRLQAQVGPDGEHLVLSPGEAFLYRPFLTSPDSAMAQRPLRVPGGDLLIWNGRLDNPRQLADQLGLPAGAKLPAETLVYRALMRWGEGALRRLIGDFSLSLWQPAQRRLLLATDIWALRPIFYHLTEQQLAWASRCRALLDALDLPSEPDSHYVASFLIRPRPSAASPFRRLTMLPGAHFLVLDDSGVRVSKYWSPDPSRSLDYRRDEDYEEHFREVLEQAVACRATALQPVLAELSGGFDSSSIATLGDRLVRGQRLAPDFETVSYVYDRASSADERRYIAPVEKQLGRRGIHIANDEAPLLTVPPLDPTFRPDFPAGQLIYYARNQKVAELMAARNARVLLRGMGGDQVTWGDPGVMALEVSDHLRRLRWRRAMQACWQWSMTLKTPLHVTLWRSGLWPLMPRSIRQRTFSFALPVESWFQPSFARGIDLRLFSIGADDDVGFRKPSQRFQFAAIREVPVITGWEFLVHRGSVECRFPFMDRRLVEIALATPIEKMLRPHETRSLARQAMRGILPETVRARTTKAGPSEVVYRTIARHWQELSAVAHDPHVARYGFVDRDAFLLALQRVRHGVQTVAPQLTRTFALEFWLRSLDCRQQQSERFTNPPSRKTEQPKEMSL